MMSFRFLTVMAASLWLASVGWARDWIVAADGSSDFRSVQAAIDSAPANASERTTILVRRGTYAELVVVPPEKRRLTLRGEDRQGTIIAAANNARASIGGRRELMAVMADDFVLENLTLHNTTPKGGSQAEALHVRADRCVLRHCDFRSFQDTLRLDGRVFVDECRIEGDVDFIWGGGTAYFRGCEFHALHDGYLVQARNDAVHFGYVFVDCRLTGAMGIARYVLARIEPGRFPDSHVAFIDCAMGRFVSPEGWQLDKAPGAAEIAPFARIRFWEFHSTDLDGSLLDVGRRSAASRQLTQVEAEKLRDITRVLGGNDRWNPSQQ
jgi:pectin methylesterase-like acyl-CoA thioesterase